jgi:hypothetical protein
MSDFLFFRSYENIDEATAVLNILNRNNIPNVLSEERALLDSNIIGQQFDLPYRVKLPAEHFDHAEDALRQSLDINAVEIEDDYYLLTFSNEELTEIVRKKDEWGDYDYALALKLLEERGVTFTTADFESFRRKRIEYLSVPENGVNIWTLVGYLSSAIGGALGLFIGFVLIRAKRTLPDGSRVYVYNNNTRTHGIFIAILGIASIILWTVYASQAGIAPPGLSNIFSMLMMLGKL